MRVDNTQKFCFPVRPYQIWIFRFIERPVLLRNEEKFHFEAQGHEGVSNITTTAFKMILILFHKHTKAANVNFHFRVAQSAKK